jgi:ankyrin repeat protein
MSKHHLCIEKYVSNYLKSNYILKFEEVINDKEKERMMHLLMIEKNYKLIKLMLENKCKIDENYNKSGCLSTIIGDKNKIKLLSFKKQNEEENSDYHDSEEDNLENKKDICKLLLKYEANINLMCENGYSPLHIAINHNYKSICKLLIKNKSNINSQNNQRVSLLSDVSDLGYIEICKLLIKNKSDLNLQDNSRKTPLHRAISKGHKEICKLLINNKCNINLQNANGETPFRTAVNFDNIDICEILINQNCDINLADNYGITPLDNAIQFNKLEIIDLIQKYKLSLQEENQK